MTVYFRPEEEPASAQDEQIEALNLTTHRLQTAPRQDQRHGKTSAAPKKDRLSRLQNDRPRRLRGGAAPAPEAALSASLFSSDAPSDETYYVGFRLSSLRSIPEPAQVGGLMGILALGMACLRRGRRIR